MDNQAFEGKANERNERYFTHITQGKLSDEFWNLYDISFLIL